MTAVRLITAAALAACCLAHPAWAQKPGGLPGNYPSKPVRVIS